MNAVLAKKISDFPSSRYLVITSCLACGDKRTINQDKSKLTFQQIKTEICCPVCYKKGLSVSVTVKKQSPKKLAEAC